MSTQSTEPETPQTTKKTSPKNSDVITIKLNNEESYFLKQRLSEFNKQAKSILAKMETEEFKSNRTLKLDLDEQLHIIDICQDSSEKNAKSIYDKIVKELPKPKSKSG